MTIQQMKDFADGRTLWQQYVNLNGYAFEPTEDGLRKLAESVGLSVRHLRKTINAFLEA